MAIIIYEIIMIHKAAYHASLSLYHNLVSLGILITIAHNPEKILSERIIRTNF